MSEQSSRFTRVVAVGDRVTTAQAVEEQFGAQIKIFRRIKKMISRRQADRHKAGGGRRMHAPLLLTCRLCDHHIIYFGDSQSVY